MTNTQRLEQATQPLDVSADLAGILIVLGLQVAREAANLWAELQLWG